MSSLKDIVTNLDIAINHSENVANAALPKTGGLLSGKLSFKVGSVISRNVDDANLAIAGGSSTETGAYLHLYGQDSETNSGCFILAARNATGTKYLKGWPDGSLKWNNNNILTSVGGNFTGTGPILTFNNRGFVHTWNGNDYRYVSLYGYGSKGGGFEAFDEDCPTNPSGFNCRARGVNGEYYDLAGRTDGNLWWKGMAVACIVGHWQSGSNWWRKWSDGWIEQGGHWNTSNTTLTFNLAFSNTSYVIVGSENQGDDHARAIKFNRNNATTTSIRMVGSANPIGICWYACGF